MALQSQKRAFVSVYGTEGQGFESLLARYESPPDRGCSGSGLIVSASQVTPWSTEPGSTSSCSSASSVSMARWGGMAMSITGSDRVDRRSDRRRADFFASHRRVCPAHGGLRALRITSRWRRDDSGPRTPTGASLSRRSRDAPARSTPADPAAKATSVARRAGRSRPALWEDRGKAREKPSSDAGLRAGPRLT